MVTISKTPKLTPNHPTKESPAPKLPNERDETPGSKEIHPRKSMKQAYQDLQSGQVDTDLHGARGVEEVVQPTSKNTRGK